MSPEFLFQLGITGLACLVLLAAFVSHEDTGRGSR